jgi:tRNA(adenine34) deaminase
VTDEQIAALIGACQQEAEAAIRSGNPPFGCVITDDVGTIVARGHNTEFSDCDPAGHAELNALRDLARSLRSRYLDDYVVFANAASCSMCASAAIKAGITRFYYGAPHEPGMDPWLPMDEVVSRAVRPIELHGPILGDACAAQIQAGRMALDERGDRAE